MNTYTIKTDKAYFAALERVFSPRDQGAQIWVGWFIVGLGGAWGAGVAVG